MKAAVILIASFALFGCRADAAVLPLPKFDHAIVVVFENKESTNVLGNVEAPTFNLYANRYATLTRYYAVTHPSLPNYLALVSGSTHSITTNCTDCVVVGTSLADTLEAAGKSWKTYAEGLPSAGFLGPAKDRYAKKHNPFTYFRDIADSPRRRARIVPLDELGVDLQAKRLPDFSLVVPDLCNSMHDCSVSVGDAWLRQTVGPMLTLRNTVIFVIFDEGYTSVRGGGHTPALVLGTSVRAHSRFRGLTGHYGVLWTIEQAWGLRRLGHSAHAAPITSIWR